MKILAKFQLPTEHLNYEIVQFWHNGMQRKGVWLHHVILNKCFVSRFFKNVTKNFLFPQRYFQWKHRLPQCSSWSTSEINIYNFETNNQQSYSPKAVLSFDWECYHVHVNGHAGAYNNFNDQRTIQELHTQTKPPKPTKQKPPKMADYLIFPQFSQVRNLLKVLYAAS